MNILIITRRFFPYGDATSSVVGNMAIALKNLEHTVSILSFTDKYDGIKLKEWNGINVVNEYNSSILGWHDLISFFVKKKYFTFFYLLAKKLTSRFLGYLCSSYKRLSQDSSLVWAYNRAINKILSENSYDICLVTLMPHEAVYSVLNLFSKHKIKTDIVILQYDTYWNNAFPAKYTSERQSFEKYFIDRSLFVMTTPLIYELNKNIFDNYKSKVISCEFPNLTKKYYFGNKLDQNDSNKKIIHCVFLGTLYKKIRPPRKVIEILKRIYRKDIVFDFYGRGLHLISSLNYYQSISNFVLLHGNVSSSDAEMIEMKADVLINIDNTNLTQVPSKIFDYMCTGKRILNFYFSEESPSLFYLKKYPSCFNINVNKIVDSDTLEAMVSFILNPNYIKIPFSEIESIFKENTPKYVVNQFLEMYKKCKNKEK